MQEVNGKPKVKIPYGSMRNQCPACGELFNSPSGFEEHRTGPFSDRRCRTPAEMAEKGMRQLKDGWWALEAVGNPPRRDNGRA